MNIEKYFITMQKLILLFAIVCTETAVSQDDENDDAFDVSQRYLDSMKSKNPEVMERLFIQMRTIEEEAELDVPELIKKHNYPVEVHNVITIDGYILELHRIPYSSKSNQHTTKRFPFFLQHGLLCSSADWIISGPEKSLAYLLADAGYDVWLGNYRGNKYSRNHLYLDVDRDREKYWDFSWHEMGIYDLPSVIDYILKVTNENDLFYAGHSQGTTGFYVMASERPEYNAKIRAQFSLAPVAYMKNMKSPFLKFLAIFQNGLKSLFNYIGMYEFLPSTNLMAQFGATVCGRSNGAICSNALFVICGFNKDQVNATLLPIISGHTPAGSATKQVLHYAQEIISGHFRKYDYGIKKNKIKYKRWSPPDYEIARVTAPIYLFYSKNDWLSSDVDVENLAHGVANLGGLWLVDDEKFNHLDYLYGIDAPALVYEPIIIIASYHLN